MSDQKVFEDSVIPLPEQPGITHQGLIVNSATPEQRNEPMRVHFSLAIPPDAQEQLEEKVAKGEVVPIQEQQKNYAPNPADVEALVSWLKAHGFQITQVSNDGVYTQASVDQIEQSLGVDMVRVTKDGLTYTAARNAPSLPADVGNAVLAISGLQPFRRLYKHSRMLVPVGGNRISLAAQEDAPPSPSPNVQNTPPYLVHEVLKAYNADGLSVTGKGQTIAILIDTFPTDSDLKAFWKRNDVPATLQQIEKINVNGGPLPPPEGEETLDVEWSSGIAPGAKVRVYATGSLRFVDLDMALDRIIADLAGEPGLRQLSISLGLSEIFIGGPQGEVATQRQKFLRLAAAGVNVFVSSGDAGSNPDDTGHSATGPTHAEYESSDPSVVGVGGTSLTLAPDGSVASETAWVGSGGGESIFFSRPSFQTGDGVPAGDKRLVPDVGLVADPDTGAFVMLHGHAGQIGGTSWSAPVWAGFCALINEARTTAQKPPLPFLNPLIYPLMGTSCFRDIQVGSNGAFEAGPGYDMVTGIGVPNVKELIQALT